MRLRTPEYVLPVRPIRVYHLAIGYALVSEAPGVPSQLFVPLERRFTEVGAHHVVCQHKFPSYSYPRSLPLFHGGVGVKCLILGFRS